MLPEDVIRAIDALASKRKLSHFIEETFPDNLKRKAVLAALMETAGEHSGEEHPK